MRTLFLIVISIVMFGCGGSNNNNSISQKEDVSVSLTVTEDVVGGVNLKIDSTGFLFTPENVNESNIDGQGHAHLYIDGEKIGRLYGEWFYVGNITDGDHEFKIILNNNDHSEILVNGSSVSSIVNVHVHSASGEHSHRKNSKKLHDDDVVHQHSAVNLIAHKDAVSGFNLQLELTNFKLTPENVNDENVEGEGHAHVYVDGEKISRVYTEWFHLTELSEGDHNIKIALSNNDHSPVVDDLGNEIFVEVSVTSEATTTEHNHAK